MGEFHKEKWGGGHRDCEQVVHAVGPRGKRVVAVEGCVSAVVQNLDLKATGRHVAREHPEVSKGSVGVVVSPVGVAVLCKDLAVTAAVDVAEADLCGDVHAEVYCSVRLILEGG